MVGVEHGDGWLLPAPQELDLVGGFALDAQSRRGCRTYALTNDSPVIEMPVQQGHQFRMTSDASMVVTRLRRGFVESRENEWAVTPGKEVVVGSTATDAVLQVRLVEPGESITLCL